MDQAMGIALFRYKIICSMLHGGRKNRNQRLKELARAEYEVPGAKEEVHYSWRTFKNGFDGLRPSFRSDKGQSRKIDTVLQEIIIREFRENNLRTVSNFYRYLLPKEQITTQMFTEATLRNFLKKKELSFEMSEKKPRKAFEQATGLLKSRGVDNKIILR